MIWLSCSGCCLFQHQHLVFGGACRNVRTLSAFVAAVYTARETYLEYASCVVLAPVTPTA
jgi:hypothetical protein